MMRILLILLLLTFPAHAADWTGLHVGLNLGYGSAAYSASSFSERAPGFLGGVSVGYDKQFGKVVLGVETDFQWTSQRAEQQGVVTFAQRLDRFGTARARAGYAAGDFLPYVTAGAALVSFSVTADTAGVSLSDSTTRWGFAYGAGLDYALDTNWSVKVEYLRLDTGTQSVTFFGVTDNARLTQDVVRAGLRYRF